MKSAFISIIGRPSSGKSTLLNTICGHKVSIVSEVPQTTRNKIRGIYNKKDTGQLIFIDTPGYNISDKKFNNYLKKLIYYSVEEADLILYMIDITRLPGKEETAIMNLLQEAKHPVIIALNKTDQSPNQEKIYRELLQEKFPQAKVFTISALQDSGTEELLTHLMGAAPEGDQYYPEEFYTDQHPEFRISEIIREKVIHQTRDEIPHSVYVEILDMEMNEEINTLWVRSVIYVERESQKGIVIGKDGRIIKTVKIQALEDLKVLFPYKIELDLRVKVKYKWRKQDHLISKLLS